MAGIAQFPDEQSADGEFVRQSDAFREWVGGNGPFEAAAGRYQLYVSLACPWASRTLIVRALKGLESAIGLTIVDPLRDERGWHFGGVPDALTGFHFLSEAYLASDPSFEGRVTVPVLWDKQRSVIVNNSEDDICRMLNEHFEPWAAHPQVDLFPAALEAGQRALSEFIYDKVNNGVYRAGFATSQHVYEDACRALFAALDALESRLASRRYLLGATPVEADWRLFCTLVRFDSVYHGHFKCNLRRIVDYPNLQGYLMDLYQLPGIAGTVNFDHIKRHYYITHDDINPNRLVPLGPLLDLSAVHGRECLGGG